MSETRNTLERELERLQPPRIPFDELARRRDRKHRNQRIRAGGLALAVLIAVGWMAANAIRSAPPVPAHDPPDLPNTPASWSRVQLDPPLTGGEAPSFLVAGPDGLAAVGVHGGPATTWTSSDGATWTRIPSGDLDRADIFDIRSGGPGFIATGSAVPEGGYEQAIWTSEDGVSWNRLPGGPIRDTGFISAVAPGGPGLVMVGSHLGAWYSSDGSTWERASVPPVPPEVYPGDNGNAPQIYLTDVADQGGRLVAVGWAMLNDNSEVVVVWTSGDGRSWTDVPTPADVFPPGSSIAEITAGPDGFVAVGRIAMGQVNTPAIWSSPDGRGWRLHRPGPDGLVLDSVAAGNGGYVAVGATMACDTDCASREAVVMTSVDGETWVRVPSGPAFRVDQPGGPEHAQGVAMSEVVAWGSRFAALGEYEGQPTVWVTTAGLADDRSKDLGIFAPVAGRIVYGNQQGIWGVDPAAPADPAATVQLTSEPGIPMGWSSDGTRLLIMRESRGEEHLFVLHADGSETQVTERPMATLGATISPDGSRVVFVGGIDGPGGLGLYAVDADGGRAQMIGEPGDYITNPTFSPDGTQIAYADGSGDHSNSVWLMKADGSDQHQILANETTIAAGHVYGLAWSPAGDRIALGIEENIYTFATDGSSFTRVITGGVDPYWSPDGSQLAYRVTCLQYGDGCGLAIAEADGSNVRGFDFAQAGPWHPGAQVEGQPPTPTPAALRREGEILVFERPGTGPGWDLAAQDPETGEVRKIVETDGIVDCPDSGSCTSFVKAAEWSSDGRWVAFEVSFGSLDAMPWGPCGPTAGLWVQGPVGDPRQLTTPCEATLGAEGIEELWAWSPDGARLAYARVDGEDNKLFVIDPADGSRTLRLSGGGNRTALAWSPDGTRIAVASEGEGIYEVAADPGAMSLLGDSFEDVVDIDYSPDGTQIMVHDQGRYRMQVMNADGSDLHLLLEGEDACCETEWSPNGDRLVYQLSIANGTPSFDSEVWTVAPDGSNAIKVFDSNGCDMGEIADALPVWAPNGTQVAYNACGTWVVSNADGTGEPQPIDELVHRSWAGGGLSGWDLF